MYRKAIEKDCKEVYRLICEMESRELPYEKFESIFRKQLADDGYYCLIYERDGQVIGVLNLRLEEQLHHTDSIAEIMEFAVDPECRGQGIGKGMFLEACRLSEQFCCTQIEVACNQLRTNTHRFYLREGMHNFHFKFSKSLVGEDTAENKLGR